MSAVILTILKIIGIVLLSILAFVLLLALLILYVPLRYRITAQKQHNEDEITASAKITYLLHMISGSVSYQDELIKEVRVFGIRIWPRREKKKKDTMAELKTDSSDHIDDVHDTGTGGSEDVLSSDEFTIDWNEEDKDPDDPTPDTCDTYPEDETDQADICDKIEALIQSLTDKYDLATDKIDRIRRDLRFWDRMIHDERNRSAVELIKSVSFKLLRKIAPRRIKGSVCFGFDDPATTGRILMYLAVVYPVMPRKFKVEPDFEKTVLYGNIDIKGRLALITVGIAFLKLYFNKDCKRMYRLYKKHKNK